VAAAAAAADNADAAAAAADDTCAICGNEFRASITVLLIARKDRDAQNAGWWRKKGRG
jgi:hypothetical protein